MSDEKLAEIEDLEVEALTDEDLESAAGGATTRGTTGCPTTMGCPATPGCPPYQEEN